MLSLYLVCSYVYFPVSDGYVILFSNLQFFVNNHHSSYLSECQFLSDLDPTKKFCSQLRYFFHGWINWDPRITDFDFTNGGIILHDFHNFRAEEMINFGGIHGEDIEVCFFGYSESPRMEDHQCQIFSQQYKFIF